MAGQRVLDEALCDPLAIYPTPFNMGKLAELVCFFEEVASHRSVGYMNM